MAEEPGRDGGIMQQYKIASFNVRNLSFGAKQERLDNLAKIIKDNNLDIIAMQEVLSEGKILTGSNQKSVSGEVKAYEHSLKHRLGNDWGICWRDPASWAKNYMYDDSRGEGYAFIWNTRKFELVKESEEEILPKIFRNYKLPENGMIRLIRDPCYGRFQVIGRKPEIRLISTHIVYGKPKNWSGNADLDMGAVTMRKNEFKILAGQIYPRIDADHKLNTVPYTIMLGDYNLNLSGSGAGSPVIPDIVCFDEKGKIVPFSMGAPLVINTVQEQLSTLKRDEDGFASNYDHFSYTNKVSSIVKRCEVINIIDKFEGEESKYLQYKKYVSDHLPIVLTIEI